MVVDQEPAIGDGLCRYAVAELDVAISALAARGSRIHEGVHRARKAMRRVRAALALGAEALGPGVRLVDRELRRRNRGLSALRDAQALVATLDRLELKAHDESTGRALHRAHRSAKRHRARLGRDPDTVATLDATRATLAVLHAALHGLPWTAVTMATLVDALERTDHRIARALDRVRDEGDDADWHRWRRRVRRLSQQHRACGAAGFEIATSPFDKSLAEQLSVAQDLLVLRAHCGHDSPFRDADRALLHGYAEAALARQRERVLSAVAAGGAS